MVRAVLLDFDGTLVDTMGEYADAVANIVAPVVGRREEEVRRLYLSYSGLPFDRQLSKMYPDLDPGVREGIISLFRERKVEILRGKTVGEGARRAISTLRGAGLAVFISSNLEQDILDWFVEKEGLPVDLSLIHI